MDIILAEPVTAATIAIISKFLLDVGGKLWGAHSRSKQIEHTEMFKRVLQNTQATALKQAYHFKTRGMIIAENNTLGGAATFLSNARIGTAGVASPVFNKIAQGFERNREQFALTALEQLTKLRVHRESSLIASDKSYDTAGVVLGIANSALEGFADLTLDGK